ncbi:MAG: DUF5054 domain-containing protein [Bryobacteraceae bacterium]
MIQTKRREFVKGLLAAGVLRAEADSSRVRRVLVVFKCHLDVGYTDTQANVMRKYFDQYYPQAMQVAATMRESGEDQYVWTTGSWLLYEYLEQATSDQRKRMDQAVAAGQIAWHALPFSWQTEFLDRSMISGALGLSQSLDRRFGRKTIGAKMSDVPCHSRGIVGPLAENGVTLLHIGVNPGSPSPEVPLVFVWKDPDGAALTMLYSRRTYGGIIEIPSSDLAISIAMRGDNRGPHTTDEAKQVYADLRSRFPKAKITASNLSEIAAAVNVFRDKFPVVTGEMGDTWIYGLSSDPVKVGRYREMARLRREWIKDGRFHTGDATDCGLVSKLLLAPEHTWGTDTKRYLDYDHYKPRDLVPVLDTQNYKIMETSWKEKRRDIDDAVANLPPRLRSEANERLSALRPREPSHAPLTARTGSLKFESTHFAVELDAQTGAIHRFESKTTRRQWASPEHPLALFSYQTLSQEDFNRFIASYVVVKADWTQQDFGKPHIDRFGAESRVWQPKLAGCWTGRDHKGHRIVAQLKVDDVESERLGRVAWPQTMYLELLLPDREPVVHVDFSWFGKAANRLPEAMWLSFAPIAPESKGWMLDKVDRPVSPFDVVAGGNRHMHAVSGRVSYGDALGSFVIETMDATVVALGEKSPIYYSNDQPDLQKGLHFSLFNNAWGTNYPQWFGGDMRFRFSLRA